MMYVLTSISLGYVLCKQHSVPGAGALGNSGIQQPAGLSGNILRPSFGPIGGLNPYPVL